MIQELIDGLLTSRQDIYTNGRYFLDILHVASDYIFNVALIFTFLLTLFYFMMIMSVIFTKKKRAGSKELVRTNLPRITIQIPTLNELAALNCAKRCLEFDYPKELFDIIIGDDSNKDSIRRQIDAFADQHDQVQVTRRGENIGFKPGNLNHMLGYTRGDYILIFDSDFLPEKDFLIRIVQPVIENPDLAGVQARWKISNPNQNMATVLGSGIIDSFHRVILPFATKFSPYINFCGSGELVNKKLLVKLGGWKAGCLTEDIEYTFVVLPLGNGVKYLPGLEVLCEVPHNFHDLFRQQKRWAYGVVGSIRDHYKNLFSSNISPGVKAMVVYFGSGYLFTIGVFALMVFGTLTIVTHRPEPVEWGIFLTITARNVLLTSGSLMVSVIALSFARKNDNNYIKFILGSFTVGLILVYHVMVGIYKTLFRLPMEWYMLKKNGNEDKA